MDFPDIARAKCPRCGRTSFLRIRDSFICMFDQVEIARPGPGYFLTYWDKRDYTPSDEYVKTDAIPERERCPKCGGVTFLIRAASGRVECRNCCQILGHIPAETKGI